MLPLDEARIESLTKQDFDTIVSSHGVYWDDERTFTLHHPMLVFEFGDTAYVIRAGDLIAAYLFGFIAQTGPVAYVHLVAVHPKFRNRGLARRLYDHFVEVARSKGCTSLKATASPWNGLSIKFHTALGMEMRGDPLAPDEHAPGLTDVRAARGYLRPGEDRVVFQKPI